MNIQSSFPLGLTGLISSLSKGKESSLVPKFFSAQPPLWSNSHPYMTTRKTIALTRLTFLAKWCFCFLICCLGFHSFPSKEQASFNFLAAVTTCSDFGAQENKISEWKPLPYLTRRGLCTLGRAVLDLDADGGKRWRHQRCPIQSLHGNTPLASLWQRIHLWDWGWRYRVRHGPAW